MAAGTVFSDGKPRFIQINGINIDAEIGRYMLCAINQDEPGVIGALGQTLGEEGVNIANFTLGRAARGRDGIGTALFGCACSAKSIGRAMAVRLFSAHHAVGIHRLNFE